MFALLPIRSKEAFLDFIKFLKAIDPTLGYKFVDVEGANDKNYYNIHVSPNVESGTITLNSTFGSLIVLKKAEIENLKTNAEEYLHLAKMSIDPSDCQCFFQSAFFVYDCGSWPWLMNADSKNGK